MKHEERLQQYGAMSNPPFHDRETYLAWVAAWKRRYAELSAKIKVDKLHQRINQRLRSLGEAEFNRRPLPSHFAAAWHADYPENYWHGARSWQADARTLLHERHQSKVTAQLQWEAAQRRSSADAKRDHGVPAVVE